MGVTSVVVRRLCPDSGQNTETQLYGYLCISYSVYADFCFNRHVSIVSWLAEQRPFGGGLNTRMVEEGREDDSTNITSLAVTSPPVE